MILVIWPSRRLAMRMLWLTRYKAPKDLLCLVSVTLFLFRQNPCQSLLLWYSYPMMRTARQVGLRFVLSTCFYRLNNRILDSGDSWDYGMWRGWCSVSKGNHKRGYKEKFNWVSMSIRMGNDIFSSYFCMTHLSLIGPSRESRHKEPHSVWWRLSNSFVGKRKLSGHHGFSSEQRKAKKSHTNGAARCP